MSEKNLKKELVNQVSGGNPHSSGSPDSSFESTESSGSSRGPLTPAELDYTEKDPNGVRCAYCRKVIKGRAVKGSNGDKYCSENCRYASSSSSGSDK